MNNNKRVLRQTISFLVYEFNHQ